MEVPKGSPGVVGLHPILAPGDSFIYASGTSMHSDRGSMHGSIQFSVGDISQTSESCHPVFDAIIGKVKLMVRPPRANKKSRKGENERESSEI